MLRRALQVLGLLLVGGCSLVAGYQSRPLDGGLADAPTADDGPRPPADLPADHDSELLDAPRDERNLPPDGPPANDQLLSRDRSLILDAITPDSGPPLCSSVQLCLPLDQVKELQSPNPWRSAKGGTATQVTTTSIQGRRAVGLPKGVWFKLGPRAPLSQTQGTLALWIKAEPSV